MEIMMKNIKIQAIELLILILKKIKLKIPKKLMKKKTIMLKEEILIGICT